MMQIRVGFTEDQLKTMQNALIFHDKAPTINGMAGGKKIDFDGVEVLVVNLTKLKERRSEDQDACDGAS